MRFIVFMLVVLVVALAIGFYFAPHLPGYGQACGTVDGEAAEIQCPSGFKCVYPANNTGDFSGVCKPRFLPNLWF